MHRFHGLRHDLGGRSEKNGHFCGLLLRVGVFILLYGFRSSAGRFWAFCVGLCGRGGLPRSERAGLLIGREFVRVVSSSAGSVGGFGWRSLRGGLYLANVRCNKLFIISSCGNHHHQTRTRKPVYIPAYCIQFEGFNSSP